MTVSLCKLTICFNYYSSMKFVRQVRVEDYLSITTACHVLLGVYPLDDAGHSIFFAAAFLFIFSPHWGKYSGSGKIQKGEGEKSNCYSGTQYHVNHFCSLSNLINVKPYKISYYTVLQCRVFVHSYQLINDEKKNSDFNDMSTSIPLSCHHHVYAIFGLITVVSYFN